MQVYGHGQVYSSVKPHSPVVVDKNTRSLVENKDGASLV